MFFRSILTSVSLSDTSFASEAPPLAMASSFSSSTGSSLASLPLTTARYDTRRESVTGTAGATPSAAERSGTGRGRSQSVSTDLGGLELSSGLLGVSTFGSSASSRFSSSSGTASTSAFPASSSTSSQEAQDSRKMEEMLAGPGGAALLRFLKTNLSEDVKIKNKPGIGSRLAAARGLSAPRAPSAPRAVADDDDAFEDAEELAEVPPTMDGERMGMNIVRRARQSAGSMSGWYRTQQWINPRNGNEARSICHALDLLYAQVPDADLLDAVECMARRLVGVQKADSSNNWNLCRALELAPDGDLLTLAEMSKTIKVANQFAQVDGGRKRGGEPKSRGGGFQWRGRGRGRGGKPANASSSSSSSSGRAGRSADARAE